MSKISDFIHNNKVYSKCCYSEQLEIDDELKRIEMLERENYGLKTTVEHFKDKEDRMYKYIERN